MINLLPPEIKSAYRYGLSNVTLMRWVMASVVALLGVGAIATYGWLNLHQDIRSYNSQVAAVKTKLKQEHQTATYAQIRDITTSFNLVVDVLKNEILFSKLLNNIAQVMPANAYLTGLSLVKDQNAVDLTAQTSDQYTATQLQVNLSDPSNQVFAKADINNIQCNPAPQNGELPCTVSIRALFAPNNQYLFINQKGSKS